MESKSAHLAAVGNLMGNNDNSMGINDSLEGTKDLYMALIKATGEFPDIIKNNRGVHDVPYEDLPDIYSIIKPILANNNLYVKHGSRTVFDPMVGPVLILRARIIHAPSEKATEWAEVPLIASEEEIKKAQGSKRNSEAGLQTFQRRYQLKLILGLCGVGDDQDGGAPRRSASPKQIDYLRSLLKNRNFSEAAVFKKYNIQTMEELSSDEAGDLISELKKPRDT